MSIGKHLWLVNVDDKICLYSFNRYLLAEKLSSMANKRSKISWKENLKDTGNFLSLIAKEFSIFLYILIRPPTIIAFAFLASVIFFAQSQSGINRLTMEILTAVLASIVGGLVLYYFIQHTGNTFLIKKSAGSIRNLQLIKGKVKNISDRIAKLRKPDKDQGFDEVDNLVSNVQRDILNSIGDWADVNPNSDALTDFYEVIDVKESEIKNLGKEVENLEEQKKSLAQDNKDEINRLGEEISKKSSEISKLRSQVTNISLDNIGVVSGSMLSNLSIPNPALGGTLLGNTCRNCKKIFYPSLPSDFTPSNDLCDECKQKGVT